MKLTDERVAKALGWKHDPKGNYGRCGFPWKRPGGSWQVGIPAFTTSLDAIVAEIEARGMEWCLHKLGEEYGASVQLKERDTSLLRAETAPMALCAALLAYLKEPR